MTFSEIYRRGEVAERKEAMKPKCIVAAYVGEPSKKRTKTDIKYQSNEEKCGYCGQDKKSQKSDGKCKAIGKRCYHCQGMNHLISVCHEKAKPNDSD